MPAVDEELTWASAGTKILTGEFPFLPVNNVDPEMVEPGL